MSKFVKGERVKFAPNMGYFSPILDNMKMCAIEAIITKVKGNTYQIKGFTGFFPEEFFQKMED